jgi:hypothetical protein
VSETGGIRLRTLRRANFRPDVCPQARLGGQVCQPLSEARIVGVFGEDALEVLAGWAFLPWAT